METKYILVVEDSRTQYQDICNMLRDLGYSIVYLQNPYDPIDTILKAKAAIAKQRPDAILIDIKLADGRDSGLRLARHLKSNTHIPFAFITGQNDERIEDEGLELTSHYLPKNLTHERLRITLKKIWLEKGLNRAQPKGNICQSIEVGSEGRFSITDEDKNFTIRSIKDLLYVCMDGRKAKLVFKGKEDVTINCAISEVYASLANEGLLMVKRGFLVYEDAIKGMTKNNRIIFCEDGHKVYVGDKHLSKVQNVLRDKLKGTKIIS